jgi:hypothetical protein
MKSGLNNVLLPTLFTVVNNIEQYCYTRVNNVGSKTLFNPVKQRAQRFYACIMSPGGVLHVVMMIKLRTPYDYHHDINTHILI